MAKLIFYFSHYNTLGHSTRTFSLVKGLKEYFGNNIEILVLQSGKQQGILPFQKYAKLNIIPYAIDKKGLFIEERQDFYKKFMADGRIKQMLKDRLAFMKDKIDVFKPDMFITEYFPFGQEFWTFELPYLLEYLKEKFKCKIIGSSGYVNYSQGTYQNIKKYYDYLFIHSPRDFSRDYSKYFHKEAVRELNNVFKEFSTRISFTGFVFGGDPGSPAHRLRKKYLKNDSQKLILVSRGGGIVNKKIILASLLLARRNKNLFFVVSCGPATSDNEFSRYAKICRKLTNVKLAKVIKPREFDRHLEEADLSINMAGYNTITRVLYYKKKTLIIPYYTSEQMWRADTASKYTTSEIIPHARLKVGFLEKSVNSLLSSSQKSLQVKESWFRGIPNTIDKIKCMIQR